MLINCKNEELIKYSKGTYNKERFIQSIKDRWELTDKQFRMACLISDLAVNAQGVFSIAYNTFIKMFEERFKMTISKPTAIRFFNLLEKIGVLTKNAAKRKNNKQSANIYIVEPIEYDNPSDNHIDNAVDNADDSHNITINKAINKTINLTSNKPLNNKDNIFIEEEKKEKIEINILAFKEFENYYKELIEPEMFEKIKNEMIEQNLEWFTVDEAKRQIARMEKKGKKEIFDWAKYFVGGIIKNRISKSQVASERKFRKAKEQLAKEKEKEKEKQPEWKLPFYNWLES